MGCGVIQPRPFRQGPETGTHREGTERPLPVGQAQQPHHVAVWRHETPRDDCQGPVPRASHPVSGRAHRGRGCRASPRHVGDGPETPREWHHHYPDHPLHRRSRGNGRPHRCDSPGPDYPGGRQGRSDVQAGQKRTAPAAAAQARQGTGRTHTGAHRAFGRRLRADLHLWLPETASRRCPLTADPGGSGHRVPGPANPGKLPGRDCCGPGSRISRPNGECKMNLYGLKAIYKFEMARMKRTIMQSVLAPVISTCLYFVVFGSAIGSRTGDIDGIDYGAYIIPGLLMLSLLMQSISNASFGIYMPKFSGTIYEVLSAPVSYAEIVLGYVGAAATKAVILGLIILATARLFVDYSVLHPVSMLAFLVLTAVTFSLFGFIIGIWADGFEKLQIVPMMIVTPLVFLGGTFYSIDMLPQVWQTISLFNPVVYLISGFRWAFYGVSDVHVGISVAMTLVFLAMCMTTVWWIFKTGYRLRS